METKFRVYSSHLETLSDYIGLMPHNPRCAVVVAAATVEQGAQALQNAGHATDLNYVRKLTNMIQQLKSMSGKVGKTYNTNINSFL